MPNSKTTATIPHGQDRAAQRLFRHRELIVDLLRGFAPEGRLRRFDARSLVRQSDRRVDDRLRQRQSDITWTFTLEDGVRVALILEVQSTVDPDMAARMAAQTAMYYESHAASAPGEPPPVVLPMVLYTGERPWRASRTLAAPSLVAPGDLGVDLLAATCYLLIVTRNIPWESLPPKNRASLMIKMWTARSSGQLMVSTGRAQRDAEHSSARCARADRRSALGHGRSMPTLAGCPQHMSAEAERRRAWKCSTRAL